MEAGRHLRLVEERLDVWTRTREIERTERVGRRVDGSGRVDARGRGGSYIHKRPVLVVQDARQLKEWLDGITYSIVELRLFSAGRSAELGRKAAKGTGDMPLSAGSHPGYDGSKEDPP